MYTASKERYTTMEYDHCGNSGLMLPRCHWDYGITLETPQILKI